VSKSLALEENKNKYLNSFAKRTEELSILESSGNTTGQISKPFSKRQIIFKCEPTKRNFKKAREYFINQTYAKTAHQRNVFSCPEIIFTNLTKKKKLPKNAILPR